MTHKKFFAKIVAFVLVLGTILACTFSLVACNKDKEKNYSISDVFKSRESVKEFSSSKLEIALDAGWEVYTEVSSSSKYLAGDVGYITELDAFVVQEKNNSYLSIVKCGDTKVYFEGGMKGQILPDYIGIVSLRVKDGLIACKFSNGECGVFDYNGNSVLSRSKISGADSAKLDDVVKILDGGLIAVAAKYNSEGKTGYTSIYRPTTSGDNSSRGMLCARIQNLDGNLSYVRGFDSKYVTVVGNDEGDYIYTIPQSGSSQLISAVGNSIVADNGKDDYYSEITYIGDGKFIIHEDWTVESTDDYTYCDGFDYYVFKRYIYTPDNDKLVEDTDNADKVFLYLGNSYYDSDKCGVNTSTYLNDGFTYASYGLTIINKIGYYDQFILDSDLDIVMSLTGNYGITIKDQKKEQVGYLDLIMQCVDGYYYNPVKPSEINIYDTNGNLVGHNDKGNVVKQELMNNIIVAKIQDPDDDSKELFGAFNLYGEQIMDFEYSKLSAFRGAYTICQKKDAEGNLKYYVVGMDGKIVDEMSDGSIPLADMATTSDSKEIYKIGCYVYKVDSGEKDSSGKIIYNFGIKNFNPNVNKNIVMPATMRSGCTLYAPNGAQENVFVFDKITVGSTYTYNIYRLI